jgi:hypothetical protein
VKFAIAYACEYSTRAEQVNVKLRRLRGIAAAPNSKLRCKTLKLALAATALWHELRFAGEDARKLRTLVTGVGRACQRDKDNHPPMPKNRVDQ